MSATPGWRALESAVATLQSVTTISSEFTREQSAYVSRLFQLVQSHNAFTDAVAIELAASLQILGDPKGWQNDLSAQAIDNLYRSWCECNRCSMTTTETCN